VLTILLSLGGTGGSVVASRLSEDPHVRILLIERGPLVDTWASHVPLLSADFNGPAAPVYRWRADVDPSATVRPDGIEMFSGKAFGGTSKVNASIYQRGLPAEYDAWAAAGREDWGWKDVRPFFEKSERSISFKDREGRGPSGVSFLFFICL
jgi:choline dehydrogenase